MGSRLVGRLRAVGRDSLRLRGAARLIHTTPPACDDDDYYRRAAQLDRDLLARARAEEAALCRLTAPLPYTKEAIADVTRHGVALLPGCLSRQRARTLRAHCLDELDAAETHPTGYDDGDERSHFSAVLGAAGTAEAVEAGEHTRWDLRLSLSPEVCAALHEALGGPLGAALEALVGADGELQELAVVVADPGAGPQVLHADADWSERATMFTAFIALQDVDDRMGPTRFLRGTHTAEAHAALYEGGCFDDVVALADARLAVLRAGDVTLYDRRLLHAGLSNHSNSTRLLFYVTFRVDGAEDADLVNANSLRYEYRGPGLSGQLRLRQLRDGIFARVC
jgi:hypothetical protein